MTRSTVVIVAFVATACTSTNARVVTQMNDLAQLDGETPAAGDPLQWKVITSGLNTKEATMYTLYGNDSAVQYARAFAQQRYPEGSTLALVTWQRQEDVRWFGAEIPASPKSVEVLQVIRPIKGGSAMAYRFYGGRPLKEERVSQEQIGTGVSHLLSLRAAVMP